MSKFRTVEISNPDYETNHIRFITIKTDSLRGRGDICVFVPPGMLPGRNVPIVILLHGVYGSCWSWLFQGGLHRTALRLMKENIIPPMIIAMPSDGLWGDGSAYLPHNNYDFEKWIVDDVPAAVIENIKEAEAASPLFISGLSMGGFGALHIGAKYSNRFRGISCHSSITGLSQLELFVEEDISCYKQADHTDEDVFETILRHKNNLSPLRFDCGTSDILISHNRVLHNLLEKNNIPHRYEEFPGFHEWPYWSKYISETLIFFANLL